MKSLLTHNRLLVVLALISTATVAQAQIYMLPEDWAGGQTGSVTNNPFVEGEKPLWKAVNVWPSERVAPINCKIMVWDGIRWIPANKEETHGGQPAITTGEYTVAIGARSAWTGSDGSKTAALVFIAPKTANYKVEGTYSFDVWSGNKDNASLVVRILDAKAETTKKVGTLAAYDKKTKVQLENSNVFLLAGQELAFVPVFTAMHTAGTVKLMNIKLTVAGLTALPDAKISAAEPVVPAATTP
jgi:hypothetical protein